MASEPKVGALLRLLVSTKRSGKFLEIGTGTGYGTAWMLDGMDASSSLDTVDNNSAALCIAKSVFEHDRRVTFFLHDGNEFLSARSSECYDLIFADSWPGKYENLELALKLLKSSGILVFDDMLPQPNWPVGHEIKVKDLLSSIKNLEGFHTYSFDYGTGMILLVKK